MSLFSIFSKKVKKENLKEDKKMSKIPDEQKNIPAGKVVTIAREFGSGGREVALKVAEKLGYKFYDKEGIIEVAKAMVLMQICLNNLMKKIWISFGSRFLKWHTIFL